MLSFSFLLIAQIILHSMHKYQPRVHVIRKDCGDDLSPVKPIPSGEGVKAFSFPETVFTTVTAYQNQQVTRAFCLAFCRLFGEVRDRKKQYMLVIPPYYIYIIYIYIPPWFGQHCLNPFNITSSFH